MDPLGRRLIQHPPTFSFFPEGRLIQHAVEPRDEEGRITQLDGRVSEPHATVATFYSGIGRLVAHSGARVLPMAHVGLEPILAAKDDRYKVRAGGRVRGGS